MGNTFFDLTVADLTALAPDRALTVFRMLLWCEASRVGISKYLIDVPGCINESDGGLDGQIDNADPTSTDIILKGSTGYQVKSSDLSPAECEKEIYDEKLCSLKPAIKTLFDKNGTYVLVLFADLTGIKKAKREDALKQYYSKAVRIYSANQILGFVMQFPSIIRYLKRELINCLCYEEWSKQNNISNQKTYVDLNDDDRHVQSQFMRTALREPQDEKCPVFRIEGLSGIGKTRFIFETLAPDDLKNRTIYVSAESFINSNLFFSLQNTLNLNVIIVVDECNLEQHQKCTNAFASKGSNFALITITNELGLVPEHTFRLKPLSTNTIEALLAKDIPNLPYSIINRIAQFSNGYPRIATLLAESFLKRKGTAEDYLTVSEDVLMNRLIGGGDLPGSISFITTKKVLTAISLFSKVGYRGSRDCEAKWLAGNFGITWQDFQSTVYKQQQRGIIQGQNYIYVTPFMLRTFLMQEWWGAYGGDIEAVIEDIPAEFRQDLIQCLYDHLPYIISSEEVKRFVKKMLDPSGIYADEEFLDSEIGSNRFLKLTEADSELALNCLESVIGKWDKGKLLNFKKGRRNIINALERMVAWKELFERAGNLILKFALSENENFANSATGIFTSLFFPGPVVESSPQQRHPFLKAVLQNSLLEVRLLGLSAADHALETYRGGFRLIGPEYQGMRTVPLWRPSNEAELVDSYRVVWSLIEEKALHTTGEEQKKAQEVLLHRAGSIIQVPELCDIVLNTIDQLINLSVPNKQELITTVESLLFRHRESLQPTIIHRLENLKKKVIGDDYHSLLHRYVMMSLWTDHGQNELTVAQVLKSLAAQSVTKPILLKKELSWLITDKAKKAFQFGYEIGLADTQLSLLPQILKSYKENSKNENISDLFLAGYLSVVHNDNLIEWELILSQIAANAKLYMLLPSLIARCGTSRKVELLVDQLITSKRLKANHLGIFALGKVIIDVPEETFQRWIEFLLANEEDIGVVIALDLYQTYYITEPQEHKLPDNLTLRILKAPYFSKSLQSGFRGSMEDYYWSLVSKEFIRLYPNQSLILAEIALNNWGVKGTVFESKSEALESVLREVSKIHPNKLWLIIEKLIGPPITVTAFSITDWLKGSGLFSEEKFDPQLMWKWVEHDPDKRAVYLASFAPKALFHSQSKACLAVEILIRYGDREPVRNTLRGNFITELIWGKLSIHDESRKKELLRHLKDEQNENVRIWIKEFVSYLDKRIDEEKEREELEGL